MKLQSISLILKDLLKVIKVVSLYPEDNPLPQSLRRSFAEKLESIVQDFGDIRIRVQRDQMLHDGELAYQDRSKEENLSALLFEAGITEITFKSGLEVEEIYKLLGSLRTYITTPGKTQDLAALIWESGISRFSFQTLEDVALSEYDQDFDINIHMSDGTSDQSGGGQFGTAGQEKFEAIFIGDDSGITRSGSDDSDPGSPSDGSGQEGQRSRSLFYAATPGESAPGAEDDPSIGEDQLRATEAASAMGFADLPPTVAPSERVPDTALILNDEFKLSSEEEEKIRRMIAEDAEFDAYESTSELLKELLMQETELENFYETVTICERVFTEFIKAAKLAEASRVLQHMRQLEDRLRKDKPLWAERLRDACVTAGSRDRLQVLADTLNENPDISSVELSSYLDNFGWEALIAMTDLMGEIKHEPHRETLVRFLSLRGRDRVDIVARSIQDKRPDVVRNAITILSHIGDSKALTHLAKAVDHDNESVRLQLVVALKDSPDDKALAILKRAISDPVDEVRREAVNSIVARRGQPAFDLITEIINGEDFRLLGDTDQQSLLNAYSVLGGDQAVAFLGRLIQTRNLFGNQRMRILRKAGFSALALNRSEKCEALLIKLSDSWRPDIKRQAQETIKRRRELTYGDDQ